MLKQFSLSKILVIFFLWGGESSYDSILVFFSNFFHGSGSLNYCYFLGGGTVRGAGRERGTVHEGGAGRGHVAFLSTAETVSFFETFFSFFQSELLGFFLSIYIHGVGIPGGSVPGRGGGVESDRGSG